MRIRCGRSAVLYNQRIVWCTRARWHLGWHRNDGGICWAAIARRALSSPPLTDEQRDELELW